MELLLLTKNEAEGREQMTEPIIAQFMLPITTKETVQELMQKGVDWGKTIGAIEELEKLRAEIEKLNNTDYGSMFSYESHKGAGDMQDDIINIIDRHIAELKGEIE